MNGRPYLTAGLVLLAIVVRVAAVLVLQSHTVPRSTYEHGEIAANLLAGRDSRSASSGPTGPRRSRPRSIPLVARPTPSGASRRPGPADPRAGPGGPRGDAGAGRPGPGGGCHAAAGRAPPARRPDRRAAPDPGLRGHPRPGRAARRDPADLDPALAYRAGRTGRDRGRARGRGLLLARWRSTDPILALVPPGVCSGRSSWGEVRASLAGPGRSGCSALTSRSLVVAALDRPQCPGPRRVRRDQEHVRLCLLAGQLRPERGDRQGRPALGRAGAGGEGEERDCRA